MREDLSDMAGRLWLILSGGIAILEGEGMELADILQRHGTQEAVEAFEAITAALYWTKEEAKQMYASAVKQEEPEHLPQHSGNTPR